MELVPKERPSQRITKDDYLAVQALTALIASEDPWRKVACVLANESYEILATGYNGLQKGQHLTPEQWSDRDSRLKHMVHAEMNALSHIRKGEATTLCCTLAPCLDCAKSIVTHRVKRFVYIWDYPRCSEGLTYLVQMGVQVSRVDKSVWDSAKVIIDHQVSLQV